MDGDGTDVKTAANKWFGWRDAPVLHEKFSLFNPPFVGCGWSGSTRLCDRAAKCRRATWPFFCVVFCVGNKGKPLSYKSVCKSGELSVRSYLSSDKYWNWPAALLTLYLYGRYLKGGLRDCKLYIYDAPFFVFLTCVLSKMITFWNCVRREEGRTLRFFAQSLRLLDVVVHHFLSGVLLSSLRNYFLNLWPHIIKDNWRSFTLTDEADFPPNTKQFVMCAGL